MAFIPCVKPKKKKIKTLPFGFVSPNKLRLGFMPSMAIFLLLLASAGAQSIIPHATGITDTPTGYDMVAVDYLHYKTTNQGIEVWNDTNRLAEIYYAVSFDKQTTLSYNNSWAWQKEDLSEYDKRLIGSTSDTQFDWQQAWQVGEYAPAKLKTTLTNRGAGISDISLYYIIIPNNTYATTTFTKKTNKAKDTFNTATLTDLSGYEDYLTLSNELNMPLRFNYADLLANDFLISEIYVGDMKKYNADFPKMNGAVIKITPKSQMLLTGETLTLDPIVSYDTFSDANYNDKWEFAGVGGSAVQANGYIDLNFSVYSASGTGSGWSYLKQKADQNWGIDTNYYVRWDWSQSVGTNAADTAGVYVAVRLTDGVDEVNLYYYDSNSTGVQVSDKANAFDFNISKSDATTVKVCDTNYTIGDSNCSNVALGAVNPAEMMLKFWVGYNYDGSGITTSWADMNIYDVNYAPTFYDDLDVKGYRSYGASHYSNGLTYDYNYFCQSGQDGNLLILKDTNYASQTLQALTCNNAMHTISGTKSLTPEGTANIKFLRIATYDANKTLWDYNLIVDLNAPVIRLIDLNINSSFSADQNGTLRAKCYDTNSPTIYYTFNLNDANVLTDSNAANNTIKAQSAIVNNGTNAFQLFCSDLAGNQAIDFNIFSITINCFDFINEENGSAFPMTGLLSTHAYDYDANSDFNLMGQTNACITSIGRRDLRFVFNYDGNTIITREFSTDLFTDINISICVPTLQSFYQQILLSGTETPAAMLSYYKNCYVFAGYTKYAYQSGLINYAYTIDLPYTLYTWVDGKKIVLSGIDGTQASLINLDILYYKTQEYDTDIAKDYVSVSADYNSIITIYYKNLQNDNLATRFDIYDGSTLMWTHPETSSPNELTIYYNHTDINFTNSPLKLLITKTKVGTIETQTVYFTLDGETPLFNPILGMIVAGIIFVFSITLVSARLALGWFGIFGSIIAIIILSFSSPEWYVIFMGVVLAIITIFIALIYKEETAGFT